MTNPFELRRIRRLKASNWREPTGGETTQLRRLTAWSDSRLTRSTEEQTALPRRAS